MQILYKDITTLKFCIGFAYVFKNCMSFSGAMFLKLYIATSKRVNERFKEFLKRLRRILDSIY